MDRKGSSVAVHASLNLHPIPINQRSEAIWAGAMNPEFGHALRDFERLSELFTHGVEICPGSNSL